MTYFSVDVETTATVVRPRGLLSIGVKVVHEDLSEGPEFYSPVWYPEGLDWDEDTLRWWMTVEPETYEASRPNVDQDYKLWDFQSEIVAYHLMEFVQTNTAQDTKSIFVANPIAFDKPWIDHLFASHADQVKNPFDYRSLCLRSMHFGLEPNLSWGGDRETWGDFNVPSEVPHHALYDAKAQAQELILMLKARDNVASD